MTLALEPHNSVPPSLKDYQKSGTAGPSWPQSADSSAGHELSRVGPPLSWEGGASESPMGGELPVRHVGRRGNGPYPRATQLSL